MIPHLLRLWGPWWPVAFLPLAILAVLASLGDLRPEHAVIAAVLTGGAVINTKTKDMLMACLPAITFLVGYELIRYLRPIFVIPTRVWGCELRAIDRMFFSIASDTALPEYFSRHQALAWDLFFALPYTVFWVVTIIYALVLYLRNRALTSRFLWVLAATHLVAFVIWMVIPAAPPWYVQDYGCEIRADALPSAAALLRVDHYFAIDYYVNFYSRAPTIFGAFPSLHCAFPAAGLVTAWRDARWTERCVHLAYTVWMLSASVYLNHHWLIDGLAGISITFLVFLAVDRLLPRSVSTGAMRTCSADR